jgi:hypothetical protein
MLTVGAVHRAFGSKRGGSHWKRMKESEGGANLPSFLSAKNYSSFISSELESALKSPILYRTNTGATPAHGIRAELFPEICGVFLSARRKGVRQYQLNTLSSIHLRHISNCVLAGLGLPPLTERK